MKPAEYYRIGGEFKIQESLEFSFNGRKLRGRRGDTLASALLANGVRVVNRSFKYHRPRGLVGSGPEEPNAIMQLGENELTVPNLKATEVELFEGLVARSTRGWPGPQLDVGAAFGFFAKMMSAGFYYKTFMWPRSLWEVGYERVIRRMAGWGNTPTLYDGDDYEQIHHHCDLLIVGGGAAGLAAALAAGRSGVRVFLAEQQPILGGDLLTGGQQVEGMPARDWVAAVTSELGNIESVKLSSATAVTGYYDDNFLIAVQRSPQSAGGKVEGVRERIWKIRARRVVLATGGSERLLVFGNNDLPGVMLAGAVRDYVERWGVLPGGRAVVATNNDSAYEAVESLVRGGAEVLAVADARPDGGGEAAARVEERGIPVLKGWSVQSARGRSNVKGAVLVRLDEAATGKATTRSFDCDLIAVSGGWNPLVHLHSQAGGPLKWDAGLAAFVAGAPRQKNSSAGLAAGLWGRSAALDSGWKAAVEALKACGGKVPAARDFRVVDASVKPLMPLWEVSSGNKKLPKFVDYQNDTTVADLLQALAEGYESIEHVKRYTALGFGTDQGKIGNINGAAIVAAAMGRDVAEVGTTTFRPPWTPISFGAIAGVYRNRLFEPVRRTALFHKQQSPHSCIGVFEPAGQWLRARYYGFGTQEENSRRECLLVRRGVALLDASTLGKIDIRGPDAAEFLNRVYINGWKKLAVGRCRYGIMLNEDGRVLDDGVTSRLAEDRFLMTTTSGGAAAVMSWLELWLQTEWPELKVYLTSVTDHWSTLGLAGPHSRQLMRDLCRDLDFSPSEFPFMSWREGTIDGVSVRIFRISFTGELSYEVNVNSRHAGQVFSRIWEAGKEYGIEWMGTEAMHVLRAEKGFFIVGQETDGSVSPLDLGYDSMVSKAKDFIGRRSLFRADLQRPDRRQLVGVMTEDPQTVLAEGAHLVEEPRAALPNPALGHISSSYFSAALGRSIALAMVKEGRSRHGDIVHSPKLQGEAVKCRLCPPVFYDPDGAIMHG